MAKRPACQWQHHLNPVSTVSETLQGTLWSAHETVWIANLKWQHAVPGVDKAAAAAGLYKPEQGNAQGVENHHKGPDLELQEQNTTVVIGGGRALMFSCHAGLLASFKAQHHST